MALASVEAISRKSTVGSGVLCATAAAMCVIVYAVSGAMSDNINDIPYDCDVILTASEKDTYYSFIDHMDNVTDTENIYLKRHSRCGCVVVEKIDISVLPDIGRDHENACLEVEVVINTYRLKALDDALESFSGFILGDIALAEGEYSIDYGETKAEY